ncbi:hypothetical protein [Bacillus sp. RS11]|uniref:hypothetical protein n=1 Tax=Lysinibacillus sp. RS11 TaxID=3242682 RepID=UPI0035C71A97
MNVIVGMLSSKKSHRLPSGTIRHFDISICRFGDSFRSFRHFDFSIRRFGSSIHRLKVHPSRPGLCPPIG